MEPNGGTILILQSKSLFFGLFFVVVSFVLMSINLYVITWKLSILMENGSLNDQVIDCYQRKREFVVCYST